MIKILILFIGLTGLLFGQTINIDNKGDNLKVQLKNNSVNLLKFPFVVSEAVATTETPENFTITSKNRIVTVIPAADIPKEETADLLIWSANGEAYLIKLSVTGKKDQIFTFSSNSVSTTNQLASRFETGKVESDIKKIMKKMASSKDIPGYKKINVKKMFKTSDLDMQKEYFYDGGKYRVEVWYLKNTSTDTIFLDYENFYTSGILSIAFEKKTLKPGDITKAWFIINKSTIFKEKNGVYR